MKEGGHFWLPFVFLSNGLPTAILESIVNGELGFFEFRPEASGSIFGFPISLILSKPNF